MHYLRDEFTRISRNASHCQDLISNRGGHQVVEYNVIRDALMVRALVASIV